MFGNGMAMSGSWKQGAEDEEVERALQEFYTGRRLSKHCVGILLNIV